MEVSSTMVVMIGAGRIGQALAQVLRRQTAVTVALWDTDTAKMPEPAVCNDLVQQSDIVFLCIPSWAMRESLEGMRECFRPDAVVVSLVKGLDPTSRATMHELMQELLPPTVASSFFGGPMLSAELERGLATRGVVGASADTYQQLQHLFAGTCVTLEHTHDAAGVSATGVLKNIYALGLGIAQALELGDNMRGWLVTQALREMHEVIPSFQGQSATVYGLAGLGDLVATSLSQHSRNRTVGEELIRTGKTSVQSEGLASLPLMVERLSTQGQSLPFFTLISDIVLKGQAPQAGFAALSDQLVQ